MNSLTNKEIEILLLKSMTELIGSMVNNSNLDVLGSPDRATVMFKSSSEQKLFYVLVVDLLSPPSSQFFGHHLTSLHLLQTLLISKPTLGNPNSLLGSLSRFLEWLEVTYTFESKWFPSIDRNIDVTISRMDMIKICGNISKHSLIRLTSVSNNLKKNIGSLKANESLVIINEFYEHFHEDILNYHATIIVELLNNLRWEIQGYLEDEFKRFKTSQEALTPPEDINNPLAEYCYWELMWMIQREPYVKKFETDPILLRRY